MTPQPKQYKQRKQFGILDFYGFENNNNNGEGNSFEQLAINYCNERIHQVLNFIQLKYPLVFLKAPFTFPFLPHRTLW